MRADGHRQSQFLPRSVPRAPWSWVRLYVDVFGIKRVSLDELATWFHLIAHQGRKNLIGRHGVFNRYAEKSPGFGVHCCFPELVRVHFPQPLISLYVISPPCFVQHPREGFSERFYISTPFPSLDVSPFLQQTLQLRTNAADPRVVASTKKVWRDNCRLRDSMSQPREN